MSHKVEMTFPITGFKPSGKYYSSWDVTCMVTVVGDPPAHTLYMDDVVQAIKRDMGSGRIPSEFIYHVDHDMGYPCLVFPPTCKEE